MSDLLSKATFTGIVDQLLTNPDRRTGLEKQQCDKMMLRFGGIEGDCHAGLTRKSDSRMLKQFKRGTEVKNTRQVSILSKEELTEIAARMAIPEVKPEWVGANLVTSGIPNLTLLPPSTRLQFPSGATLVVDLENLPCRYPAAVIENYHPELSQGFVKAAKGKRGVVGWVEAEGDLWPGDAVTVWLPPQRLYQHT